MTAKQARAARAVGAARRTYLCLEGRRRKPSDYEITTTALLYYPPRGFEVDTPVWQHYQVHQGQSWLKSPRWETFEDPAHTTYSTYVARRRDQEAFLDRLFERPAPQKAPSVELLGLLSAVRFVLHGFQMTAAYVGALAPTGRVSVASAFQAADELRRIQRICQWLSRSGMPTAELDALGREKWQQQAEFQPLRRLIEELLVTYDFGDALVGLNVALKPVLDRLLFEQLVVVAKRDEDEVLEQTLRSLAEDGHWHEAWSSALLTLVIESNAEALPGLRDAVQRFRTPTLEAARALLGTCGALIDDTRRAFDELEQALDAGVTALLIGGKAGRGHAV